MNPIVQQMSSSATHMIRMDHAHVLTRFHRLEPGLAPETRAAVVRSICAALEIHAQLEEEIFYPALRACGLDSPVLAKSEPEHAEMRRLIERVRSTEVEGERWRRRPAQGRHGTAGSAWHDEADAAASGTVRSPLSTPTPGASPAETATPLTPGARVAGSASGGGTQSGALAGTGGAAGDMTFGSGAAPAKNTTFGQGGEASRTVAAPRSDDRGPATELAGRDEGRLPEPSNAEVHALMNAVLHHVADEETQLLPAAERLMSRQQLAELGARMTARRLELARPRAGELMMDLARGAPGKTALVTVGALLAGSLLVGSLRRHHH